MKSANKENFVNSIINGDCSKILKKMKSNYVDLVLTSPPYDELRDYENVSKWNFNIFQEIAKELFRVLKQGGVLVWVVGDMVKNGSKSLTSFKQALFFQEIGFKMFDVIIYEKSGASPPHNNRYFNSFEYMFILSKGKPKTVNILKDKINKYGGVSTYASITRREKDGTLTKKGKKIINKYGARTNIWRYSNGKGFSTKDKIAYLHPAIFPDKLAQDHILSWSNPGEIVLDPFAGSGTTGKNALLLGRKYILIEAVKKYCNIAKQRIEAYEK